MHSQTPPMQAEYGSRVWHSKDEEQDLPSEVTAMSDDVGCESPKMLLEDSVDGPRGRTVTAGQGEFA